MPVIIKILVVIIVTVILGGVFIPTNNYYRVHFETPTLYGSSVFSTSYNKPFTLDLLRKNLGLEKDDIIHVRHVERLNEREFDYLIKTIKEEK